MDACDVWESLSCAIDEMQRPGGDHNLKLATVTAGVELLFEFPAQDILRQVRRSALPIRAVVSWLVFEGARLPAVDPWAVRALQRLYEAGCPCGEGIIPPPPPSARIVAS